MPDHTDTRIGLDGDVAEIISALDGKPVPRTAWPYKTPTGYTYQEPTTYDELRQTATTAAQAEIETWDPSEHPPAPTWAMVGLAQAEVLRLLQHLAGMESDLTRELETRDRYHDLLDRFAYAVAPESQIGEHSSLNDPWARALQILEGGSE